MVQNTVQQLTQAVQNMLQILQQAGAADPAAADPTIPPAPDGSDMPPASNGMPPDAIGGDMGDDDDDMDDDDMSDPSADDSTPAAGNDLHSRVQKLEHHTGLKKSASPDRPLIYRIDELEEHYLGETFQGSAAQRVDQLESVLGLQKSASTDEAPETIALDSLIKSAIGEAESRFMAALDKRLGQQSSDEELPSPDQMRKSAQQQRSKFGQRKATQPATQGDEELIKSARSWGMTDGDLDEPVTLGDALQMQYAAMIGGAMPFGDDED
jgi:hypothetical protein